jgi:hypothetical protein
MKTPSLPSPVPAPFCRPVLCWTAQQAAQFAYGLTITGVAFQFAVTDSKPQWEFLVRAEDYSRANNVAQSLKG